jgi:hypothetical protein
MEYSKEQLKSSGDKASPSFRPTPVLHVLYLFNINLISTHNKLAPYN